MFQNRMLPPASPCPTLEVAVILNLFLFPGGLRGVSPRVSDSAASSPCMVRPACWGFQVPHPVLPPETRALQAAAAVSFIFPGSPAAGAGVPSFILALPRAEHQ